jgi:hypothetical protein
MPQERIITVVSAVRRSCRARQRDRSRSRADVRSPSGNPCNSTRFMRILPEWTLHLMTTQGMDISERTGTQGAKQSYASPVCMILFHRLHRCVKARRKISRLQVDFLKSRILDQSNQPTNEPDFSCFPP